jgi:predicted Rossmann fold nucleotide-binding protein DprA/Smf involved in DNA uptake
MPGMAGAEKVTALISLLLVPGAGNGVARAALQAAERLQCSVRAITDMKPRELIERLPPGDHDLLAQSIGLCATPYREKAEGLVARGGKAGLSYRVAFDADYPSAVLWRLCDRAPALLSFVGNTGLLDRPSAAVVGARVVSDAGRRLARTCGRDVAKAGRVLISGGADGVDDTAQRGAAAAGGSVIAVLPQGLLSYRGEPYIRDLLREQRILLVSACLPDAPWQRHAAVERNDLIAALADTVAVIEPKKTGGSIRTARAALAFSRRVAVRCVEDAQNVCEDLRRAGAIPLADGRWLEDVPDIANQETQIQSSLPGMDG